MILVPFLKWCNYCLPHTSTAVLKSLAQDTSSQSLIYSLGSVGKVLMSLDRREWTALNTLVFPQVMHAAIPRCRGLKWERMAGGWSTDRRKLRISSPVQMLEKFAWFGCSWNQKRMRLLMRYRGMTIQRFG